MKDGGFGPETQQKPYNEIGKIMGSRQQVAHPGQVEHSHPHCSDNKKRAAIVGETGQSFCLTAG
jgi:hypothetical protein